jgi:hypothetical protein
VSQGVAWSYSEEHTREIQRRETVESAPTRTASLRSEATQHHLATTPRGARVVAFSRVVAPLGGAQVHRVEIGEGKNTKEAEGRTHNCINWEGPKRITTEKLSFRPSKGHPPSPDRELGSVKWVETTSKNVPETAQGYQRSVHPT